MYLIIRVSSLYFDKIFNRIIEYAWNLNASRSTEWYSRFYCKLSLFIRIIPDPSILFYKAWGNKQEESSMKKCRIRMTSCLVNVS